MRLTRRRALEMLAAAPLAAVGGCCASAYPRPIGSLAMANVPAVRAILEPPPLASLSRRASPIVDVHAHFFNASDVPVRGFLAECLAHRAPPVIRQLLEALAPLADILASRAPAAGDEIAWLGSLLRDTASLTMTDAQAGARQRLRDERRVTADRVADVIKGSDFERLYNDVKRRGGAGPSLAGSMSDTVLAVVTAAETPSEPGVAAAAPADTGQADADAADGVLGFLYYMLSYRASNLDAYVEAFRRHERAFGIDVVLGCLVDFDYWLDCPPRSAHDDQVRLHGLLAELHGGFLRPVVAYNPWTDINQSGAGLARVVAAVKEQGFVAAKIYPPTGFLPAANATTPADTRKRRPNLRQLDAALDAFFDTCARLRIPVIAHAARSNGRDNAHDEFSGPDRWRRLLERYATRAERPVIDLGHFGGGAGTTWTRDFAVLMHDHPNTSLFADLGYWEELMCADPSESVCVSARERLREALKQPIGIAGTVADRTMFGTDWLMLSQVKRWADYPAALHASVLAIDPAAADRVFGANAVACFALRRD